MALLVSLAYDTSNYDHLTAFTRSNIPLILVDRVHNLEQCSTIVIDNFMAGYEATEHLIEQGCKNILHIGGNLGRSVYAERYRGFKAALEKHQIKHSESNFLESDLDPKNAEDLLEHLGNKKHAIDGIFVANDRFAANCIRVLKNHNYKVPEDIKVIGFNNDPICQLITPTLSTIDYPGYKMGILAAQSIINHLNGNINLHPANSISLRHQLIVRQSSLNTTE
ncbi:MAG: substrate-binding domain-containing protein [Bacteroidota bacterium]